MSSSRHEARQRLTRFLGVPADLLDRVRWLFFLFLLVGVGLAFPGLGSADVPVWPNQVTAALALATLVTWALWVYRTGGRVWVGDLIPVAVLTVVGLGLGNPGLVASQGLAVLYFRSLFGSRLRVFLNATAYAAVYIMAVWRAEGTEHVTTLRSFSVLVGFVVTAALIHALSDVLSRYQGRALRESILTEAGAALLAADDRDAVIDVAVGTAAELAGESAEVQRFVLDGEVVTTPGAGAPPGRPAVEFAIGTLPSEVRHAIGASSPVALDVADARPLLDAGDVSAGARDAVIVVPLGQDDDRSFLVVSSPRDELQRLLDPLGRLTVDVSLALDRSQLTEDLQQREAQFRGVVESSSDVIAIVGPQGRIRFVNPSVRSFGYEPGELVDVPITDLIHEDDRDDVVKAFARQVAAHGRREVVEFRLAHADGGWRHVEVSANRVQGDRDGSVVVNLRDVSERKELEAEITFQAFHDPLTGLANRALLMDHMQQGVARAERAGRSLAVALLDLDDFKAVNDNLGHAAGDALLVELADRLRAQLRDSDTVARLGGDEFAMLLENVKDAGEAIDVIERTMSVLRRPVTLEGQLVAVQGSVGVALSRGREVGPHDLMRNADVAMYAAKAGGKGRVEVFDASMHVAALERLELRADLESAVDDGQLRLHYQPLVDLGDTDHVEHFEALLRWEHPRRGTVSPAEFIPLAEETRLIVPMGRWVLERACAAAVRWRDELPDPQPGVSVNLSAVQLQHEHLVAEVEAALDDSGLRPGSLTLEVTETALMHDTDAAVECLRSLKGLGVRIAIDDFGTGYSSFGYLNRFPIDVLKVDRTFVDRILEGPEDAALAHAIVKLAQTLGLETVAEGIESAEQVPLLRSWGCDVGQGYLFSPPLPEELVVRWVTGRDTGTGPSATGPTATLGRS